MGSQRRAWEVMNRYLREMFGLHLAPQLSGDSLDIRIRREVDAPLPTRVGG